MKAKAVLPTHRLALRALLRWFSRAENEGSPPLKDLMTIWGLHSRQAAAQCCKRLAERGLLVVVDGAIEFTDLGQRIASGYHRCCVCTGGLDDSGTPVLPTNILVYDSGTWIGPDAVVTTKREKGMIHLRYYCRFCYEKDDREKQGSG